MEKVAGGLGWLETPLVGSDVAFPALTDDLCGDADRCGVIISDGREYPERLLTDALLSLVLLPAGVRGGDWTADVGGDILGDASPEPARRCLLLGVVVPDATFGSRSQYWHVMYGKGHALTLDAG